VIGVSDLPAGLDLSTPDEELRPEDRSRRVFLRRCRRRLFNALVPGADAERNRALEQMAAVVGVLFVGPVDHVDVVGWRAYGAYEPSLIGTPPSVWR
jgi:hypothetical protein